MAAAASSAAAAPELTLYAHPVSQPSRSVIWLLTIKEAKHTLKVVTPGTAEAEDPTFLGHFPLGYIPALETKEAGDEKPFRLVEGAAILEFLAARFGWKDVLPEDLRQRAQSHSIMHWHHTASRKCSSTVFRPLLVALRTASSKTPVPVHPEEFKQAVANLAWIIEDLQHLAGWNTQAESDHSPYLIRGHPSVTIADFLIYSEFDQLDALDVLGAHLAKYPKFKRWIDAMKAVPLHNEVRVSLNQLAPALKRFIPE